MSPEAGSSSFRTPEPGSTNFVPERHCGLEPYEQTSYDGIVLGALDEVDKSVKQIESMLINPI